MKRRLIVDPPNGNKYGFPKAVPIKGTIYYGSKWDYGVQKEFNLPQAIRKIQSGIQLCNKSFNN